MLCYVTLRYVTLRYETLLKCYNTVVNMGVARYSEMLVSY